MKMVSLLKKMNIQPYLNMFKKKRSNKGVMWASLISIGASALMMLLSRGKHKNITSTIQNFTKNITKNGIPMMNDAALTEFAEEFQPKNMQGRNDNANNHHRDELNEFSNELQLSIPEGGELSKMNDAALTEFSEELLAKAIENK